MRTRPIAATLFAALAMAGSPLAAQQADAPEKKVGPAVYGPAAPAKPAKRCNPNERGANGQIVVCGNKDDAEFRVKSSAELDPDSDEALNDGQLHAPDVSGPGIFKGKATIGGMCLIGGCPGPPAYMIDFDQLPDAPEGSDADRIAKGEKSAD